MTLSRRVRAGLSICGRGDHRSCHTLRFLRTECPGVLHPEAEMITRNALPADQVTSDAVLQILVGPPPGGRAVGSDAFPTDDWRHLDNSITPIDICARARIAWDTFSPGPVRRIATRRRGLANRQRPAGIRRPASRTTRPLRPLQLGGRQHRRGDLYRLAPRSSPPATRPTFRLIYTPDSSIRTSPRSSPSRAARRRSQFPECH